MKKKIKKFTQKFGAGLKQEFHETKEIPRHIKNKNYKEASQQVADLGKMAFIASIWALPAGSIISGVILKFCKRLRPTSFQEHSDDESLKKEDSAAKG